MAVTKTLLLLALPAVVLGRSRRLSSTPSFDTSSGDRSQPSAFTMISRVYIPYNNMSDGLAFGMGAAEQVAYDDVNKYAYAISEQGFVNVIDWNDAANPVVKSGWALDLKGEKLTDIEVCASKGIFFVGSGHADTVSDGTVRIYSLVDRASPQSPMLRNTITVGPLPDMLLPNGDCTKVAVANEGEGDYGSSLVDPMGYVNIIAANDWTDAVNPPTVNSVDFAAQDDAAYKAAGVHLPLELNAMIYWDDNSHWSADLDFTDARASYDARNNLEPEYLAWSGDGTKVFVNLQENNAIAVISVPASGTPTYEGIHTLGLKDHSTVALDIAEDDACTLKTYSGLKALRQPDSIAAVTIDGEDYILTANEGDDKGYGKWEEKFKLKDLVDSDGSLDSDLIAMTVSAGAATTAQNVHADQGSLRVTVGSAGVDYSDPAAPVVSQIVAFGGRGMSIYKYKDMGLNLVWDSESLFETKQCEAYPWAHNGIQDEEFAPVWGVLYNTTDDDLKETLDDMNDPTEDGCADGGDGNPGACPLGQTKDERSAKDGSGTESVAVGLACGSLIAVTATEKQSSVFVFDISDPMNPELLFVKHLSPASETKNPGVAYADQTLGEIDPESVVFLDAEHSPSGKAGVMFAGAWSGSMSFWEFTCPDEDANGAPQVAPAVGLLLAILAAYLSL